MEFCEQCQKHIATSEGSVIETRAAPGPSWASAGGDPPEYDWICFECQGQWADHLYDYDPEEEDLWDYRNQ